MVAKITKGSSLYGAVSYNQKKIDKGQAEVINTNKMIIPRAEKSDELFSKTLQSFEPYLSANKRTKKSVIHISLNPSLEDSLDDAKLSAISDEYMEKLGYGDQPYIVYKHTDIDRIHLHIVSVNIDSNGDKIYDGYDKLRSMDICRELEKKHGLKQCVDTRKEETQLYLKKIDYFKGDIKRQISNTIKSLIDNYSFQSLGEYNALLSLSNINMKHVRGENEGNLFNGIVYNATTDAGQLAGNPIKSSNIGKEVGYEALNRKMNKTATEIKAKKINLKQSIGIISNAKQNTNTKEQFQSLLKLNNIETVFRENQEGRIYGVTFVDHNNKTVYNGSRLGKEFSANIFNQKFNGNPIISVGIKETPMEQDLHMHDQSSIFSSPVLVDEIFGSFYFNSAGYDPEEEVFKRKLKRKKKNNKRKL